MKKLLLLCTILFTANQLFAGSWTIINHPNGGETEASGISNGIIVGSNNTWYSGGRGFSYDGKTWTTLDYPGARNTMVTAIDGSNIIGFYQDMNITCHAFLYDGRNYTAIDEHGMRESYAYGIKGDYMFGESDWSGFLYNITSGDWTTLDYPGARYTTIRGIMGDNLVGSYSLDTFSNHGFIYNMTSGTWTNFDKQGSYDTAVKFVSGNLIGGTYSDSMQDLTHGFLYDGQTWTYLDCPGAAFTNLLGGDGTSFVGRTDLGAFIYTIPEPATLLLLTLGGLMLKKRR